MENYSSLVQNLKNVKPPLDFQVNQRWEDFLGFRHYAVILVKPSIDNTAEAMKLICQSNLPFVVAGGKCNSFFSTNCYSIVVSSENLKGIEKISDSNELWIGAGEDISELSRALLKSDKRASAMRDIPGSIGGAVVMNAGAFGIEMVDFLREVLVCQKDKIYNISKDKINFGYRYTEFQNYQDMVILKVKVGPIKTSKKAEIEDQKELDKFRRTFLEYQKRNLGSTMATKKIYKELARSPYFRVWQILRRTIFGKVFFKLALSTRLLPLSDSQKIAVYWLLCHPRSTLRVIKLISPKTLNTFCFDDEKNLKTNKDNFFQYLNWIRETSKDLVAEGIRIL